jgi:hypothetical protein
VRCNFKENISNFARGVKYNLAQATYAAGLLRVIAL